MSTTELEGEELDALEVRDAPPSISGVVIEVRSPLYPTEDAGAVGRAITNLFPALEVERIEGQVMANGTGPGVLAALRRRLRELRIRDTARSVLRRGADADRLTFRLNKQTAVAHIPNFATEAAPLGDIEVEVSGADATAVLEWLCDVPED